MNFFIRMSTIYCQISIHVRWNKGGKWNKARSIEGSKRSQVELINWCSQVELIYRNDESKCKKARGWTITVWSIALFKIDSILFLRRKWLLLKHPSKYLYTFQSDSFLSTCVTHMSLPSCSTHETFNLWRRQIFSLYYFKAMAFS